MMKYQIVVQSCWEGICATKYCSSTVNEVTLTQILWFIKFSLGDVKDLHQRVYNRAKSWFTNLPLIPRVSCNWLLNSPCQTSTYTL